MPVPSLAARTRVLSSTIMHKPYDASQARAAATIASTPVSNVGWITGAKRGLWLVGNSPSRPSLFAFAYMAASVPPTNQNTDGACHSAPNDPKSSLADVG